MLLTLSRLWRALPREYTQSICGMIRFDCQPLFFGKPVSTSWHGHKGLDLGEVRLNGLYEINTHAPECVGSVLRHKASLPSKFSSIYHPHLYVGMAIKRLYGSDALTLSFVPGCKRGFKNINRICRELHSYGITIKPIDDASVMHKAPRKLWRFGDLKQSNDQSEYQANFYQFMSEYPHRYFNSLPVNGYDLSDKKLMLHAFGGVWNSMVGANSELDEEILERIITSKDQLVIKPFSGTRGRDVLVGADLPDAFWQASVENLLKSQSKCGVYTAQFLMPRHIPNTNQSWVFDLNPCCWAQDGRLQFLYAMSRAVSWEEYNKNHVVNISRGAVLGGAVMDPRFTRY